MRISGLAYLNSDGDIQLHKNVVEGQSIFEGSLLFGIYYPRSKDVEDAEHKSDFMLTPIPFDLWPSSSRLIITLKRQSHSIQEITTFLKLKNVSIIHSVSNRSAHRYSTWDIHISFDKLLKEKLTYVENKSYYQETKDLSEQIAKEIKYKYNDSILFYDQGDIDLDNPVIERVNTALHYFHYITLNKIGANSKINERAIYKPFTLRYISGNFVSIKGQQISKILSLSRKGRQPNRILPTIAFVESQSHYLNFRIRIISRIHIDYFFKLSIFYDRNGLAANTTRGLFDLILLNFPKNIKIWMSYNELYEYRKGYECGRINFIIEYVEEARSQSNLLQSTNLLIKNLNSNSKPKELEFISFWPKTTPIYPNYIRKHFKKQREFIASRKLDVFICYSTKDNAQAEEIRKKLDKFGLKVFKADKEVISGDPFNEKIRKGLNDCREVCLLYSPSSKKSEYVITEWGAAWFMGKKIVTFYMQMSEEDVLSADKRLSSTHLTPYTAKSLTNYCNEVLQRRLEYYLETDKYEYYD